MKFVGNSFILTKEDTLCVKVYSNNQSGDYFAVGFGQFFGMDWIHVDPEEFDLEKDAELEYYKMLARAPEHVQSMDKAASRACVCITQTRLHQFTLRTDVVRKSSGKNGIKLEVFRDPGFDYVSGEWTGSDVVGGILPVSAHCFCISIDITHTRIIENIKTWSITPHSKSMTVQSPSMASPAVAHTQRNSQEIISF